MHAVSLKAKDICLGSLPAAPAVTHTDGSDVTSLDSPSCNTGAESEKLWGEYTPRSGPEHAVPQDCSESFAKRLREKGLLSPAWEPLDMPPLKLRKTSQPPTPPPTPLPVHSAHKQVVTPSLGKSPSPVGRQVEQPFVERPASWKGHMPGSSATLGRHDSRLSGSSTSEDVGGEKMVRGVQRMRFSSQQNEALRNLAEAVGWNTARVENSEAALQVCQQVGIDLKQLKKWISNHRPRGTPFDTQLSPTFSSSTPYQWHLPTAPLPFTPQPWLDSPHPTPYPLPSLVTGQPPPLALPPLVHAYSVPMSNSPTGSSFLGSFWGEPSFQRQGSAGCYGEAGGGPGSKLRLKGDPEHVKRLVQMWMAARLRALAERRSEDTPGEEGGVPQDAVDEVFREALEVTGIVPGPPPELEVYGQGTAGPPQSTSADRGPALQPASSHCVSATGEKGLLDWLSGSEEAGPKADSGSPPSPSKWGSSFLGMAPKSPVEAVLFEKVLTPSDTNSSGRIVLPKGPAEQHMPVVEEKDGICLEVEDAHGARWSFRYRSAPGLLKQLEARQCSHMALLRFCWCRYWPNNKSRMYIFEHTQGFVRTHQLQPGDTLVFCRAKQGHLVRAIASPAAASWLALLLLGGEGLSLFLAQVVEERKKGTQECCDFCKAGALADSPTTTLTEHRHPSSTPNNYPQAPPGGVLQLITDSPAYDEVTSCVPDLSQVPSMLKLHMDDAAVSDLVAKAPLVSDTVSGPMVTCHLATSEGLGRLPRPWRD